MSRIFIDKIDTAPVQSLNFEPMFEQWLMILVDTLNEVFRTTEAIFNGDNDGFHLPQKTTIEINTLEPDAEDGTMWYCTDSTPPNIVAKINGSLRQLDHSVFP